MSRKSFSEEVGTLAFRIQQRIDVLVEDDEQEFSGQMIGVAFYLNEEEKIFFVIEALDEEENKDWFLVSPKSVKMEHEVILEKRWKSMQEIYTE